MLFVDEVPGAGSGPPLNSFQQPAVAASGYNVAAVYNQS